MEEQPTIGAGSGSAASNDALAAEVRAAVREEVSRALEVELRAIVREELRAVLPDELRPAFREELRQSGLAASGEVEIAPRWMGGEILLRPGREGLQEKPIPIEAFFHKVVMARERLRVLEQRINNHPKLNDAERLELQEYITRIYGSFTTFNVLFADRLDWFVGSGRG